MRVTISQDDISRLSLQHVDIRRFIKHLEAVDPHPFDQVHIYTCWGLSLYLFQGQDGEAVCSVFNDVLELTQDVVVSDQGQVVERYAKVVEELVKRATDKLKLPPAQRSLKQRDIIIARH